MRNSSRWMRPSPLSSHDLNSSDGFIFFFLSTSASSVATSGVSFAFFSAAPPPSLAPSLAWLAKLAPLPRLPIAPLIASRNAFAFAFAGSGEVSRFSEASCTFNRRATSHKYLPRPVSDLIHASRLAASILASSACRSSIRAATRWRGTPALAEMASSRCTSTSRPSACCLSGARVNSFSAFSTFPTSATGAPLGLLCDVGSTTFVPGVERPKARGPT
mmetsp:Transcript_35444/g.86118  ORF Transcript_35444/g.86118 Transcript_35444/m.86118 type:complete len:218 (-) Transcript_35444:102-755(-)